MKLNEYVEKDERIVTGMQTKECERIVSETKGYKKRTPKEQSSSEKWKHINLKTNKKNNYIASKKKMEDPDKGYNRNRLKKADGTKLKGIKSEEVEVDEAHSNTTKQKERFRKKIKKLDKKRDEVHKFGNSETKQKFASSGKVHAASGYNRNKLKAFKPKEVDESPKKPEGGKRNPVHKNMHKTGKPGVHDKDKKKYDRKVEQKKNPDVKELQGNVRTASIYD